MGNFDLKTVGMIFVTAIVLSLLFSFPMMLLWNYCLVPAIPALAQVGWLQMWGIALLIKGTFQTSVSFKS